MAFSKITKQYEDEMNSGADQFLLKFTDDKPPDEEGSTDKEPKNKKNAKNFPGRGNSRGQGYHGNRGYHRGIKKNN